MGGLGRANGPPQIPTLYPNVLDLMVERKEGRCRYTTMNGDDGTLLE
jgi:hypothetical protein